jgi:hypothetical protein
MNLKSHKWTIGKHIPQNWKKRRFLTLKMGGATINPKKEPLIWLSGKAFRRNWARLIQKIYEVDPLVCPKCQGIMKVISFIEARDVIEKILKHLGLWLVKPRPPPRSAQKHYEDDETPQEASSDGFFPGPDYSRDDCE